MRPPGPQCTQALFLGGCALDSWADVDQLDRFPALTEVRLTGNVLMQRHKTGGRFEVRGGTRWRGRVGGVGTWEVGGMLGWGGEGMHKAAAAAAWGASLDLGRAAEGSGGAASWEWVGTLTSASD